VLENRILCGIKAKILTIASNLSEYVNEAFCFQAHNMLLFLV